MPTLATNSIVLDAVMNEMRIPVSNLTERAKIQRVANGVYADICAKQDWWWLQRRAVINTSPRIDAGTVNVTQNSTTITFSTAPQQYSANVSITNYVITLPANSTDAQAAYRISAHTSGVLTATLDGAYTGETATAQAYRLFQTAYDLPEDLAKLLHVKRYGFRDPLYRMGIEDLSYLQMTSVAEGPPRYYSIFDFNPDNTVSGLRQLQVGPFPDLTYRLEVWYKHGNTQDASSDLSLPMDYQQVLIYGTLARGYPIFLNDLERGTFYQALFNDVMALMAAQQREYASDHPGVAPVNLYRSRSSRRRVGGTSLGSYFDTLPYNP